MEISRSTEKGGAREEFKVPIELSDMDQQLKRRFTRSIIDWYEIHGRKFPWRDKRLNPYEILIAEMMLQRTRAEKVARYYEGFLQQYPNLESLAMATIDELTRVLEPLGLYNRRARWMKSVAETVVRVYGGTLPEKASDLRGFSGFGPYIVDAVRCFSHGHRVALIDVNIARILGRVFCIDTTEEPICNDPISEVNNVGHIYDGVTRSRFLVWFFAHVEEQSDLENESIEEHQGRIEGMENAFAPLYDLIASKIAPRSVLI